MKYHVVGLDKLAKFLGFHSLNYKLLHFNIALHFRPNLAYKKGSFRSCLIPIIACLFVLINCYHATSIEGMPHRKSRVRSKPLCVSAM